MSHNFQVERRQIELQETVAPDYQRRLAALNEAHAEQTEIANKLRAYQLDQIERLAAAGQYCAERDFEVQ